MAWTDGNKTYLVCYMTTAGGVQHKYQVGNADSPELFIAALERYVGQRIEVYALFVEFDPDAWCQLYCTNGCYTYDKPT